MASSRRSGSPRRELKGILDDLNDEEKESVEMIRGIFVQLGRALAMSFIYSNSRNKANRLEMESEWENLADEIVKFALED